MRSPLILLAMLLHSGVAAAGPYESARYLHWTAQDEAAAALIEPWLATHPDDLEAHALYIEIRVAGMGEGKVLKAEYEAWQPPTPEVKVAALEALDRAHHGEPAAADANPLPSRLNKRWVKYLLKHWAEEPSKLRGAVEALWGLDAPIGEDADNLRTGTLALLATQANSGDPIWLEATRAASEAADIPGLSLVALQKLIEVDSKAWPGALDDDAQRKVRKAARAVAPAVALERLDKLTLPGAAADAEQLRQSLRAASLAALGRKPEALKALEAAWKADPNDADAAIAYAAAAIRADGSIEVATQAVKTATEAVNSYRWSPTDAVDGMLWPEAYSRLYSDRRVSFGRLDRLRKQLDRMVGLQTVPKPAPAPVASAVVHIAAGKESRGRVGSRHLVEAVRLARLEGNKELEAEAKALLEERGVFFLGGLDAQVDGWNTALGKPNDLRPLATVRAGGSIRGEPLTDFGMTIDGKASRLTELPGLRVLGAVSADCDACVDFLRDLDAEARGLSDFGITWLAIDTAGDSRSMDKVVENADLVLHTARTEGGLPEDLLAGGIPRLFVVSPEGVVLRDTDRNPTRAEIGATLRAAISDTAIEIVEVEPDLDPKGQPIEGTGGPESLVRVAPAYPQAAHWLGSPTVQCMARVVVQPDGRAFHVENGGFCNEPFISATRAALEKWSWEAAESHREAFVVIDYAESEEVPRPELPPSECIWWGNALQDGQIVDAVSNCPAGTVRPGPVPWSESPRTDSARVSSTAGSVVIHNVDLPASCDVVLDVGKRQISTDADPGTCTEAVRADTLERVRRWDWDVGIGRDKPVRVVLHFEPPGR